MSRSLGVESTMAAATDMTDIKVLFVDDEKNILSSIRRLMFDEPFQVLTAESGEEGLALLHREENIGLIVSDQRMPVMNGAEFLANARNLLPDVPRIILTGYADVQAAIDAINRGGAACYLKKPWNDQELVTTIHDVLERYLLQRENQRLQEVVQQQNQELQDWNKRLKSRVLEQTSEIRCKNEELYSQNSRLRQNIRQMIAVFSKLIELRDKSISSHGENVARLSQAIAEQLQLGEEETNQIVEAALLHDIGKIGISDAMLKRSMEELSGNEIEEYMQHAIRGQMALDDIVDLRPVGLLIRHHHEWFDGTGYPEGKRGDEIPLGSRIIAIADQVDRMLGESPTKGGLSSAMEKLKRQCGSHFDPQLYPCLEKPVGQFYAQVPLEKGLVGQILDPNDLHSGMILAKDLYSPTGLLLLKKGTELDIIRIESILRYHRLDPFPSGVTVLVREGEETT